MNNLPKTQKKAMNYPDGAKRNVLSCFLTVSKVQFITLIIILTISHTYVVFICVAPACAHVFCTRNVHLPFTCVHVSCTCGVHVSCACVHVFCTYGVHLFCTCVEIPAEERRLTGFYMKMIKRSHSKLKTCSVNDCLYIVDNPKFVVSILNSL